MSTHIEHLISTMGLKDSVTSSIYVNKFDYNSIEINSLREIDDSRVDTVIYNNMRDLIDIHDAYQEYEVYLVKVPQLDSIRENVTTDNNNTEATQPPSAVVEEKRPFFSTIRNKTSGDVVYVKLNMFINFYHYNMLIPDRNDTYICLCCVETIDNIEGCRSHVETEKHKTQLRGKPYLICFADNIIRRVRDNCSHCGICNKIVLKKDLDDHIETDKQHDTLKKYGEACAADILKVKSEVDINNYINVQVAEESILLHRQYWHMYYVFPRKYFCSLCVVGGDVESLQKHLDSSNHLTRLSKCRILPEYGLSIIRTLSENHHHCGVCNTYLMVDVVDNHIKKPKHKSNLSLWMELTKQQMPEPKEKEGIEDSEEKIEVKKEKTDLVKKVPKKPDEPEIPNEDVIIEHNGYKFCLNVLSFNAIVKAKLKFFCMCCSKHMEHDKLLDHINMEEHKTALGSTEIISEFAEHFIRKIHSLPQVWAHCGICNCRMTYNIKHVQSHIETTKHRDNFTQHTEKMLKKSEQMAVTRIIPKNPIPVFSSKSEKFSHEIEISNQKYNLNLHTFKAWHTIRGWGMYFSCCFVCQTILTHPMMYRHTRSQEHKENLKNCVILECYGTNYLKVINYSHFVYCTFCNDLVDTDSIDSHVKSDSHLEKKKCGITKLVDIDGRDSKLLNQFKKLVQPLDPNIEDVILTNEARNLESCESNLRLEHSSSQKVSADAVASSSKLSELEDDHSIKTTTMKCQYGSFGVLQEKTQNNERYKDVTQMNNSEYIILDFLQDRILLTFNAWNTIVENTFCNTCKMKFITDVKKHCNEPTHIKKVNAECYELSDGSIARKYSKSKITCLLCQLTVKILKLDEHIQSTIHLKNLKRASICGLQSPHQNVATRHMSPVSISVTYMQRNVSVQNQENATDGYVLLEFSNNKLVLTYNSWNGIVENRMTCHVCNDKYIKPDIPSIMEHCNKDQHKFSMKKKVIQANFIRKITKIRFYCMICNFIGNYTQSQEHIYSELHEINEIKARMQAATAAGNNGIEIINCSQYFNLYNVAYQRNANGPAQTAVCNSQECIASDDCDSEDCSMNRDVGIPTEITNSLIPVAYEPTADEKITVKNMKTGDNLMSSDNTIDNDNEKFSVTMIGFSQKSLESVKLSKSTVHCVDDKKNDECSSTTNETLSAVAASDVEDVAIEEINIINKNNASNIVTELCHLCGWAVPMQFYTEHLESKYHKKMVELVQAVLERMKNSVNQICVRTTKNSVPMGIQYCCLCNCTLGDEAFKQHSHSNMHKDNMNVVGVIEQAVRVLQSSGSNQLSEERTEGLASVESGLEECVTVTGDMKINEKLDNIKLDHTILVPNVEKQQNSVDCCNERDEACSVDMSDTNQMQDVKEENSKGPHYDTDVTVVDITSDLVTLQIEGQKFIIDKLSYHGVYPKPGNTLWCVLCKSKKNEDHFTSEEHLKRLNEIKFNGVDLIRYLSAFYAHCALCHLMVSVTELEDHLKSATHESSRISTIMLSENEHLRNECTLNLQEFVLTQVQECDELELGQTEMSNDGVFGDENVINDTNRYNKKEVKALDSKSSDRSLTMQSNTSTDTVSQLKTDTEADGINRETVQNEVKPCLSTGYVCSVCGAEVPSIDEKTDHEKSLRHVANIQAQATTRRERSPSILINPNNAPVMNKPDLAVGGEIKNEFIRMHTGATFPYSCSLCDAKISCFAHVGDHLKGARHAQNLIRLNSNSVNALNMNAGDDVGKNSPMACTTQNTQSQNALIGSILNSRAVNKTKTTENSSEMTCTVCNVKVQKSIWEQHVQGKNHVFNLKDIMLVKPDTQNGEQTLIDNMNTSKLNGNIRELSIKPNIKNAVEAQVDVKSSNSEKNSALNKDKPSLESTAVSVSENQSQLQSISINKNTVDRISAYEAMFNKQIKSDFISFVAESTSCVYLCFLCNAKMPSLQHVEPHLRGAKHMMNLERFNNYSTSTDKISLKESVATAPPVNNSIQSAKATAKIPLNPSSLVSIPESPAWTFCRVCKVKVPKVTWQQHSQGKIHQSALHPVVQIISSSSPSTSGLPTVKHGVVHRTSSASVVKVKRSNEAAMVTNTKSERHIQAQNPNIVHQSHSSAGLLSKPPLVERVRIVPVQSSSSSVKVVKPKHSNQTICTVCNVTVPNANMTEHIQGKLHLGNLKKMYN